MPDKPKVVEELDEAGNPKVAPVVPEPVVVTDPPAAKPVKLELTKEDLDAQIAEGVALVLQEREKKVREEEAIAQGNFKALYEDSQKATHRANLALWRAKAGAKYKLTEPMIEMLSGDTEEEILTSAKNLDKHIRAEIDARSSIVIPPDPHGRTNPHEKKKVDTKTMTRQVLKNALAIGRVASVRH